MGRRPYLKKFDADPANTEDAIIDINQHQERVRGHLNNPRTHLTPVRPATEPIDGELLFDGDSLYIVVRGVHRRIIVLNEADSAHEQLTGEIKRVEDLIGSNREGILAGKRAQQNFNETLMEYENNLSGLEQSISGVNQSLEEFEQIHYSQMQHADEARRALFQHNRTDIANLRKELNQRLFKIGYDLREVGRTIAALDKRIGGLPDWIWEAIRTKEDLLDAVDADRGTWGEYGGV